MPSWSRPLFINFSLCIGIFVIIDVLFVIRLGAINERRKDTIKGHLFVDHAGGAKDLFRESVCVRHQKSFHTSSIHYAQQRLSPQEVTDRLRSNEYSQEFATGSSIKSYDSNQLASNKPIEDTRAEAQCLLTTGMLYGVFDGHGGAACAQVIAKRLFKYITVCLLPPEHLHKLRRSDKDIGDRINFLESFNEKFEMVEDLQRLYDKSFDRFITELTGSEKASLQEFNMDEALVKAFLRLDSDISREALEIPDGKVDTKTLSVAMSGAVACVAHVDGPHLHVASAGDCKAVLGVLGDQNNWSAKVLTTEHNAENIAEVERLYHEHPSAEKDTVLRVDRLLGQLAPLRALGDFRYKWERDTLAKVAVPFYGEHAIAPHYYTPPYLTARPDVTYHRLRPKDKFLVIASDGLWDLISPLQVARLVGEHMSGKVTLSPFNLPRPNMMLNEVNEALLHRKEGLKMKPIDKNAATHLIRNALGGTEYGINHAKLSQLLALPQNIVRLFRDDITITVVYFDADYLRLCPL